MTNSGKAVTVELLTEEEQKLAERIDQTIKRISTLRMNRLLGGMLAAIVLFISALLSPMFAVLYVHISVASGPAALLAIYLWGTILVAVIGSFLWYLLYARSRIRRQLAILDELAADQAMPRIRRKLYQIRAAKEKLEWPASLELLFTSTAPRSVRRLFPTVTIQG